MAMAQPLPPDSTDLGRETIDLAEAYIDLEIEGDCEKALQIFLRLRKTRPDDPLLAFLIGRCYLEMGRTGLAVAQFQRSLEQNSLDHYARGAFRDIVVREHARSVLNEITTLLNQQVPGYDFLQTDLLRGLREAALPADFVPTPLIPPPHVLDEPEESRREALRLLIVDRNPEAALCLLAPLAGANPADRGLSFAVGWCYLDRGQTREGIYFLKRCLAGGSLRRLVESTFGETVAAQQAHRVTERVLELLRAQMNDASIQKGDLDRVVMAYQAPAEGDPALAGQAQVREEKKPGWFEKVQFYLGKTSKAAAVSALFVALAAGAFVFGPRFGRQLAEEHEEITGTNVVPGVLARVDTGVNFRRPGGSGWEALSNIRELLEGFEVRTDRGAVLETKIIGDATLVVDEESDVTFQTFRESETLLESRLEMALGKVLMQVPKAQANEKPKRYYLETPVSVALVRGTILAVQHQDASGTSVEVSEGEVGVWLGHQAQIDAVAVLPGFRSMARPGARRVVLERLGTEVRRLDGHAGIVHAVTISPDVEQAVSTGADGTVRLWNLGEGTEIRQFFGHAGPVTAVAFSPTGDRLVTGGSDQTVRIWNVADGSEIRRFAVEGTPVASVEFSPDGAWLLTCEPTSVRLWNVETGGEVWALAPEPSGFTGAAFFIDRNRIVASQGGIIRIWSIERDPQVNRLGDPAAPADETVLAIAPSRSGRMVISSTASAVTLWDTRTTYRELRRFEGHTGSVLAVAFSPDERRAATGGQDQLVRVWDTADGRQVYAFEGHSAPVRSVAFSSDGRYLISAAEDQSIRLWAISTAHVPGTSIAAAGTN